MALINSKASIDAANSMLSSTLEGEAIENDIPTEDTNVSPYKEKSSEDNMRETSTTKASGIHVFSNILLTPVKSQTQPSQSRTVLTLSNLSTTVNTSSKATISGTTPSKQSLKYNSGSLISKLPMPPKVSKPARHNGNDDNMDIESPYSPGSSDYEDWFEPPPASPGATSGHVKKHAGNRPSASNVKGAPKNDIFEDLFGATSPINKKSTGKRNRPANKRNTAIKGLYLTGTNSQNKKNWKTKKYNYHSNANVRFSYDLTMNCNLFLFCCGILFFSLPVSCSFCLSLFRNFFFVK